MEEILRMQSEKIDEKKVFEQTKQRILQGCGRMPAKKTDLLIDDNY